MNTRKLFGWMSVLLVLSLVLAACGGAQPAPEVSGTIVLWHALKDSEQAGLAQIIADFQADNPNVEFELLFTPFDDLRGKYETAAATGEGPTILIGGDDWGPALYQAQLVADLSGDFDSAFLSNVNQAALAEGQFQGAQVGLPYVLKGVVMYRNNSIISEAPASAEDLVSMASAATSDDIVGADLEYGFFFSAAHLYGLGGQLMTPEGDPAFNTDAGVAWLELLASFQDAGPVENYNDNDVNLFKAGNAGLIIDGTWNLADLAGSIGEDNLSIDPWPSGMSGFVQSGYIYLNANATGGDRDAAVEFIRYLMTPEAQARFVTADQAFIPSVDGVDVPDRLRQEAVAAFAGGTGFITIPEMGAYWDPMNNAVLRVVQEGADPATVLAEAEESVQAAVAEIRGQ